MLAPRVSVALVPGAVVEVRNEREGWTERVEADALAPEPVETGPAMAPVPGAVARAVAAFEPRQRDGDDGNCQAVANRFHERLREAGIPSRRVDLSARVGSPFEGHAGVEVWSEEDRAWVYVDPFFAAVYCVDGRPASALDLHRAVVSGRVGGVAMESDGTGADPWRYRINPIVYFRNVLLALPGDAWLVYREAGAAAAPVPDPGFAYTDSDVAFAAPPDRPAAGAAVRRVRGARGVAADVVGGRLYVAVPAEGFATGAWSVRVAEGLEAGFAPALEPYDLDDAVVCRPGELLANPRLADADGDGAPDGWRLEGAPARLARDGDALVVETGAEPCSLTAEVDLEADVPIVVAGRLRVERGRAGLELVDRRARFGVEVGDGLETSASPVIVRSRGRDGVRVTIAPGSRCRIAAVGLRYGRTLAETLGRDRAP